MLVTVCTPLKLLSIVSLDKYIFTHPYLIVLCSMRKTHDKKFKSIVLIMHNHIETVYIAQLSLQKYPKSQ